MNIICWFRYINPHISHVFKSLLSIDPNLAITIMVFEDLPAQRKTLGWKSAEVEGMEVIVLEKREWFDQEQIIIRDQHEAIHVFLDFWTNRRFLDYGVHNMFLEIFYTGGIFSFTGWLIIYVYIRWESIKMLMIKNKHSLTYGMAASALSIDLMDQFQDAVYQREKWLVFGLLVGLVWIAKEK